MRLLGIDYGTKRIGLALSDEMGAFSMPHSVIKSDKKAVGNIKRICEEKSVEKIVLGESVDYAGNPNPVQVEIEKFKIELEKEIGLPVVYQSEVLTTMESLRAPERKGPRGKVSRRRDQELLQKSDASAAALILRSFIETNKMLK